MADAVYLFEAKGLQTYILEGGKLRDAVGGSELVDRLCRSAGKDLLNDVLVASGIATGAVKFSRRAGGAFAMHSGDRDLLVRFRQLWQLVVQQYAPGLEFEDALTDLKSDPGAALGAARDDPSKRALRGGGAASLLPVAGPFVRRSQRTGAPAVETRHKEKEDVDRATQRKRMFSDKRDFTRHKQGLAGRFAPNDNRERVWPTHFVEDDPEEDKSDPERAFPFDSQDHTIAVVHIDGNGMGERLHGLDRAVKSDPDEIDKRRKFSEAIEQATQGAAGQATKEVLDPGALPADSGKGWRMPARPIVLGGDDLTAIIRGDLAIPFVRMFLQAFEKLSAEMLKAAFPNGSVLTEKMTACAGVVFIGATQPFYLAYDLAADLCTHAKREMRRHAGPVRSGVQFHRVTTSFIADWDSILRDDLSFYPDATAADPVRLTTAYSLDEIARLEAVCRALRGLQGRGGLRESWSLLRSDVNEAARTYRRWREAREKSREDTEKKAFKEFNERLSEMGANPERLIDNRTGAPLPLGDLLALIESGYGRPKPSTPAPVPAEAGQ